MQVTDRSGAQSGEFTDLSKVEKFEISDDAYEKRAGNRNMASNFCLRHICVSSDFKCIATYSDCSNSQSVMKL